MNIRKLTIVTLASQITLGGGIFTSAHAAISNGAPSVQPLGAGVSGEMFVNIWDQAAASSYLLDLGTTVDDFLTNSASNKSWALDQTFINWAAQTSDPLIFNMAGNNEYHDQSDGSYGVLMSRLTGIYKPPGIALNALGTYGQRIRGRADFFNAITTKDNQTNYAENLSMVTVSTDKVSGTYFDDLFWGKAEGINGWVGSGTVRNNGVPDQTLDLFSIHLPCGIPETTTHAIFDPLDGYLTLDVAQATLTWHSNAASSNQGNTISVQAVADTYISSDATTNYSGCSGMMISANVADSSQTGSAPRTMYSVVGFNMADIKAGFDAKFGVGLWDVNDVSVKFYSNYSIPNVSTGNTQFNVPAPGYFKLSWISNDAWFDPAASGPSGLSVANFLWSNKDSYLAGATVTESVSPDAGFYWAGADYNSNVCGGIGNAAKVPACNSQTWILTKTANLINDIKAGGYVSLLGTPADSQVVYLVNQLEQLNAHPQILVTAQAKVPTDTGVNTGTGGTTGGTGTDTGGTTGGTTTGTGTDTGGTTGGTTTGTGTDTGGTTGGTDTGSNGGTTETPAPVVISCSGTKPVEDVIQNQWLVHSQQALSFDVTAYDCQARAVNIKLTGMPKTSGLIQSLDISTGKQKAQFTWTPPLSDVEKTYTLKFKAEVKTKQGVKSSLVRQTKITVQPPIYNQNADPRAELAVSKVQVSKAIWHTKKIALDVQGQIKWKGGVPKDVRAVAISQMLQIVDAGSNTVLAETQANLAGSWKITFNLPVGQITPTQVKAIFKSNVSANKKVSTGR